MSFRAFYVLMYLTVLTIDHSSISALKIWCKVLIFYTFLHGVPLDENYDGHIVRITRS